MIVYTISGNQGGEGVTQEMCAQIDRLQLFKTPPYNRMLSANDSYYRSIDF